MSELKFRAWQDNHMLTQTKPGVYATASFMDHLYEDAEVMQYTGLRDKNRKEIYEGDLLNEIRYPPDKNGNYDSVPVFIKDNIVQVGFNEGCFTADEAHLWRFISNISDNEKTDYEIIGNIHENPELLP